MKLIIIKLRTTTTTTSITAAATAITRTDNKCQSICYSPSVSNVMKMGYYILTNLTMMITASTSKAATTTIQQKPPGTAGVPTPTTPGTAGTPTKPPGTAAGASTTTPFSKGNRGRYHHHHHHQWRGRLNNTGNLPWRSSKAA